MKSVIAALTSAGVTLKVLKVEFHAGALDVEWLPTATANGWILLTKDDRWRYHPEERKIIVENRGRAFVFVSKTATAGEIADTLVRSLPRMAHMIATTPAPFIAHILLSGHITLVFPKADSIVPANAAGS